MVRSPRSPAGKCPKKFHDSIPEINRQRQDGAELNDDRVHFPKTVVKIEMQQRFHDAQVRGRTDRKKFGESFNHAKKDREQVVVHLDRLRINRL